jgi:ABC-type glycerol-3-phosphate transport system substrate-binding protein
MLPLGSNTLRDLFFILLQQSGGQIFDEQGRIAVNSPAARASLDMLRRLRASGIGADVLQYSPEYISGLNTETIASYPGAVWLAGTIKDTARDATDRKSEWGVFRLPALTAGGLRVANLGGSVLVIPAQCRDKATAWAFVEFALCTREAQAAQYRRYDLYPAFLPALRDPAVRGPDPFFGGQRAGELFARDVTRIRGLHMPPGWNEASDYLDQSLSQWAATGMKNDGFLEAVAAKMERRLDAPASPPIRTAAKGARG